MEKEITIVRVVDASAERVWKAWTDPKELVQWWGPNDVTIPECEVDLRVGGRFYIVMEAGEAMGPYKGTKWPMLAEFTAVEPNTKLAYNAMAWTEGAKEETTIDQTTEIMLTEENGKTKVEVKAAIHKTGPKAGMAVQGMEYGFNQQLDKLNAFVA
jgi:uncharacterized protein YndB with AHSA1/START domain